MRSTTAAHRTVLERIGWVPFACAIGALLIVGGSGLTWITSPYFGRNDTPPPPAAQVGTIPVAAKHIHTLPQLSPHRIVVPKLHAQAPIRKIDSNAQRELDIPLNPKIVGWWDGGAKPGARRGTAIIAGHINYAGVTGTLADIGSLHPGNRVRIYGSHHGHAAELTFRITGVRTFHKTRLPYERIFSQDSVGRLAIVTCGGPFDESTGNYLDNVVAFAVPTRHAAHTVTP